MKKILAFLILIPAFSAAFDVFAQEDLSTQKITETVYIFNTLLFVTSGMIAMLAVIGFSVMETGAVKEKNMGIIVFKNSLLLAITSLAFYLCGYNLIYQGSSNFDLFFDISVSFPKNLVWHPNDSEAITSSDFTAGYAASADWFFQMIFAAITVLVVSGVIGARMKLWSIIIFSIAIVAFIYPVSASWQWGGGWLRAKGFADFAGSTLVYSLAGWCALMATILIGPRQKRFEEGYENLPRANLNFTSLGVFILWISFLAINSGAQLALGSAADAVSISNIIVNTHLAACAGMVAALLFNLLLFGKVNLFMALSGVLGGLVSISADPLLPSPESAIFIGAIGGLIVVAATLAINRLRIDDVSGIIPIFLACGIWGTLIVPFSNDKVTFDAQLTGVIATALFAVICSFIVLLILRLTFGLKVKMEADLPNWE